MDEYTVWVGRTIVKANGRSYDLEVDVYSPNRAIDNLAILAPSWFTVGERIASWAQRLAAETGTLSVLTHFPGHGRTPPTNGSEGAVINLDEQIASLTAAKVIGREECRARGYDPHGVLYGGSSGGLTVAVMVAVEDSETRGIFGISPFCSLSAYGNMRTAEQLTVMSNCMSQGFISLHDLDDRDEPVQLNVGKSLPSLARINLNDCASRINVPIWMGWGSSDTVSGVEYLRRFAADVQTPPADQCLFEYDTGHSLEGYDLQVEETLVKFVKSKFPKSETNPSISCSK